MYEVTIDVMSQSKAQSLLITKFAIDLTLYSPEIGICGDFSMKFCLGSETLRLHTFGIKRTTYY